MSGALPSSALAARAVLVTRPEPGGLLAAAALRERGWQPVVSPFLRVAGRRVQVPAQPVQAVVVASGQAADRLPQGGTLEACPVLAVGEATARRARMRGFTAVRSADGDALGLVALARRSCDPRAGALLLVCGAGQGHALAAMLRADGFAVLRRVAYAARPVRRFPASAAEALRAGSLHAALFLSAETARAFALTLPPLLAPRLAAVDALAIGERAAAALHGLDWRHVRVARRPTLDGVLALL